MDSARIASTIRALRQIEKDGPRHGCYKHNTVLFQEVGQVQPTKVHSLDRAIRSRHNMRTLTQIDALFDAHWVGWRFWAVNRSTRSVTKMALWWL